MYTSYHDRTIRSLTQGHGFRHVALYAHQDRWVVNHEVQADQVWQSLGGVGLDLESISTRLAPGRCTERNIDAVPTPCAASTDRSACDDLRYKVNGSAAMTDPALVRA
jgi:hypothetical protein